MKYLKLILLLIVCNGSCAVHAQEKFHYDDCVKVNKGFYEGCVGRIKEGHFNDSSYMVYLTCKGGDTTIQSIDAVDLDLQKDEACNNR
jgi:hypothetical protein